MGVAIISMLGTLVTGLLMSKWTRVGGVQQEFYTALPCSDAETTREPGFIFGIRDTDVGAGDGSNWRKPMGC